MTHHSLVSAVRYCSAARLQMVNLPGPITMTTEVAHSTPGPFPHRLLKSDRKLKNQSPQGIDPLKQNPWRKKKEHPQRSDRDGNKMNHIDTLILIKMAIDRRQEDRRDQFMLLFFRSTPISKEFNNPVGGSISTQQHNRSLTHG